jgi:hypothetical protein
LRVPLIRLLFALRENLVLTPVIKREKDIRHSYQNLILAMVVFYQLHQECLGLLMDKDFFLTGLVLPIENSFFLTVD